MIRVCEISVAIRCRILTEFPSFFQISQEVMSRLSKVKRKDVYEEASGKFSL